MRRAINAKSAVQAVTALAKITRIFPKNARKRAHGRSYTAGLALTSLTGPAQGGGTT